MKAKIILLGSPGQLLAGPTFQGRSLTIEHVSPASLVQQEISRRTPLGQQAAQALIRSASGQNDDRTILPLLRKWFWARKPDAGFLLEGFPATLLQALVFDEWLEARGEFLTACVVSGPHSAAPVSTYYRTQGLPIEVLSS